MFDIYIDPSGHVRTLDGTPIGGATVTLFRSDRSSVPFEQVPDGNGIMAIANRRNPDLTDNGGRFGWDTVSGYYKVRAAKDGCTSPSDPNQLYVESAVLAVPPAVTDLDLRLKCNPTKSILFTTESQGTLRRVNQDSGATTIVGNMGTKSIVGLSNRPGDTTYIYGVGPTNLYEFESSRLVRINTITGEATSFPAFDESTLGMLHPTAYAIAISPTSPNIAIVAGTDQDAGVHYYLWKVDVDTGAVLGVAIPTTEWLYELAYSRDGSVLYGANVDGQLVTVNIDTGAVTLVGDPGLNTLIEGLAFRPSDGGLFAIDGYVQDRLIRLDPADGSLLEVIGSLGVSGPIGLAFIPSHQLHVNKSGNGHGTVASNPVGINCGSTCSYEFNANTDVTLTASVAAGSTFNGWSGGGCAGTGTCTVSMTATRSITANFAANPVGSIVITPGSLDFGDQLNWVKSDPQTVTITNYTGSDVHIGTLKRSSGKYLLGNNSCNEATLAVDASCTFEVVFRPTAVGVVNATVTIPSDAPGAPHTISLTGNGVGGTQLMTNNSFELDSNGDGSPNVWQASGLNISMDGLTTQFAKSGSRSVKLVGQGGTKSLKQVINHTGSANDDFLFVLWSKAQNVPSGYFYRTQISFYNGNTLVHRRIKDFTIGTHDWEYQWVPISVPGAYDRIEFEIIYKRPSGTVWFDSASLKWAP